MPLLSLNAVTVRFFVMKKKGKRGWAINLVSFRWNPNSDENEWMNFFANVFFLPRWRFRNFWAGTEKKISGPNIFRKWRTEPSFEILQFQRILEEIKPFVFELFLLLIPKQDTLKWHCLDSVTTLCRGIIRNHGSRVGPGLDLCRTLYWLSHSAAAALSNFVQPWTRGNRASGRNFNLSKSPPKLKLI